MGDVAPHASGSASALPSILLLLVVIPALLWLWSSHAVRASFAAVLRSCARAALSRLERKTGAGELFVMSVEEFGNPRRSLDINLYRAGLRVKAVADLLETAALDLGSPAPETRASLARCEDLALGHLSLGVARRGAPFLTLYFGVEAH